MAALIVVAALLSPSTLWCLLCGSKEPRHIDDILFGLRCLRYVGCLPTQVRLFLDAEPAVVRGRLKAHRVPTSEVSIHPSRELATVLAQQQGYETVVVCTSGHGSVQGAIAATPDVPLWTLLSAVKGLPQRERAVLVLGQCYAGGFRFHNNLSECCVIGATDLHPSVSLSLIPADLFPAWPADFPVRAWTANIFLFSLFGWLVCPSDIDGDGKLSLLDAYKFAGIQTNERIRRAKIRLALEAQLKLSTEYMAIKEAQKRGGIDPLRASQRQQDIEESLTPLFLHQEPWIDRPEIADGIWLRS